MYAAILVVPMSTASPSQGASARGDVDHLAAAQRHARLPAQIAQLGGGVARHRQVGEDGVNAARRGHRLAEALVVPAQILQRGRAIPTTQLATDGCASVNTSSPSNWVRCSAVSDSGGTWTRQSLSGSARQARR